MLCILFGNHIFNCLSSYLTNDLPKATAGTHTEVGLALESITKKVTLDKIRLYRSQWPRIMNWNNDYDIVKKWGVDKSMVFASQFMEYSEELLIKCLLPR